MMTPEERLMVADVIETLTKCVETLDAGSEVQDIPKGVAHDIIEARRLLAKSIHTLKNTR